MSTALEKVTRDAVDLPRHQRFALVRFLIEMDEPAAHEDGQRAWDAELSERVHAVQEGRTEGIPYEQVLARVDRRLGP
ncbi:MAG: addiction module protein [Verrucomicrobiae bacterium]|nr:addiction module protein [Verrucomicrobiae bacterium]